MEMALNSRAVNWFASFYRSAVGKKAVMAVSGIVLFGFVFVHMAGNLKIFAGPEKFNHYSEWLREVGSPMLPHGAALWIARLVLLTCVGLHITAATQLTFMNRRARPEKYLLRQPVQLGYAERTMRWSGYLIAAYVIFHVLHFTTGTVHPGFVPGDAYYNVVSAFQRWPVALAYIIANTLLGMHLYHGLWSLFQSLGWSHPRYNAWRRTFAVTFAVVVAVGFVSVPVAVLAGLVS